MATSTNSKNKKTEKNVTKTKGKNPVGRPKNTYGKDTLLNNKKSFKVDKNVVLDKHIDALLLAAIILIFACLIMYFLINKS